MARYKPTDYSQGQFISVQFEHQILPGTFEHTLSYLVDNRVDFSFLDERRKNDGSGAPAYDPRVMLKIVLYAHAHGIVSSRELGPDTLKLFVDVLLYCDELGLIGKEMFAVDGCKLPSNASKEWSGTRADFERKKTKFRETIEKLIKKRRDSDGDGPIPGSRKREEKAIENLKAKTAKIEKWLNENPEDKKGAGGGRSRARSPTRTRPRWPPAAVSSRATTPWRWSTASAR